MLGCSLAYLLGYLLALLLERSLALLLAVKLGLLYWWEQQRYLLVLEPPALFALPLAWRPELLPQSFQFLPVQAGLMRYLFATRPGGLQVAPCQKYRIRSRQLHLSAQGLEKTSFGVSLFPLTFLAHIQIDNATILKVRTAINQVRNREDLVQRVAGTPPSIHRSILSSSPFKIQTLITGVMFQNRVVSLAFQ